MRVQQNRKVVAARYPHYRSEYAGFINDDPIQGVRQVFYRALERAGSPWLARAVSKGGSGEEFARAVPASQPSASVRLAVWQHRIGAASAAKVLALARIVSSRPELKLRLLILGEANEAQHTGVVDVIPVASANAVTPPEEFHHCGPQCLRCVVGAKSAKCTQRHPSCRVERAV